jgi:hypothetical protein
MNSKPTNLTFKFKFRDPKVRTEPMIVNFERPNTDLPQADAMAMMSEGKLPLPSNWQHLSNERLEEIGFPRVRWSKKYKVKYVFHAMNFKTYDSWD